jgi:ribose transport system ATP-binding protein
VSGHGYDPGSWDAARARRAGVVLVPGDRVHAGGIAGFSSRANVTFGVVDRYRARVGLDLRAERREAAVALKESGVVPDDPEVDFGTLSGGNQQKIILARCLAADPVLLVLQEPTQGIDIGAKKDITRKLKAAATSGLSIVVASEETPELIELCDRIIVIRDGKIAGEVVVDGPGSAEALETLVLMARPPVGDVVGAER